jgi:hypothetical protein
MKPQFPLSLLVLSLIVSALSPLSSALADENPDARVLFQCKLLSVVPGYIPEELAGYLAPTDMLRPGPGQPHVYPNIHFSRGQGVEGIVYGFHDEGKPGSRLLLQIFEGKEEKASAYQKDPESMSISYVRSSDQAHFELSCRQTN